MVHSKQLTQVLERITERYLNIENADVIRIIAEGLHGHLIAMGAIDGFNRNLAGVLAENSTFDLDGFIIFRLKPYKKEIDNFFDILLKKHAIKKRFSDFGALIKECIKSKTPLTDTLHIVCKNSRIYLYDTSYKDCTHYAIAEYMREFGAETFMENEFLISALLLFAPKKVMFHGQEGRFQTLKALVDSIIPS